jgi:hypothetical protein
LQASPTVIQIWDEMGWIEHGESGHRWVDWTPHPARVRKPPREMDGRCDPMLLADLYPDRLELRHGWCWSSGHAELYEEAIERTLLRAEADDWAAEVRRALSEHLGPEAARTAGELLRPPDGQP